MRLTRSYRFSASHRLHAPALGEEENRAIYGKCNNAWGHGHNYVLQVSVAGRVNEATGQLVNVGALDALVRETAIDPLDHRDLNRDVEAFARLVPTSENVAIEIERRLRQSWPATFPALAGVRLLETKRNSFEILS